MTTSTALELVITVPELPPTILNPNRKGNPFAKNRAAQEYAKTVKMYAIDARNRWEQTGGRWPTLSRCTMQLIISVPHKRRSRYWQVYGQVKPDEKNLEAALKSAIDALTARDRGNGCIGAGIIEDDSPEHLTWLPTLIGRGDEEQVRVIVREAK